MTDCTIDIQRLPHAANLPLPEYETDGAAGMDVRAAIDDTLTLGAGDIARVPTGFALALPEGFEAQIRPRSGLAAKHGITVLNTPGTIDSDYRGEVVVILVNLGRAAYTIEHGARIAQLVVAPVARAQWNACDDLDATARGNRGFGSTGEA